MRSRRGIGSNRGFYFTDEKTREHSREYRNKHDYLQLITPLGTRERLKALGISRKQLFIELAEKYINEKSKPP